MPGSRARPSWVAPMCLALCAAGLAVSGYITVAHYTSPSVLACSASGLVNCERVTTSAESTLLGVPVALLGIVWFFALGALTSATAWASPSRTLAAVRIALVSGGMAFVLYLVYSELFRIGALCLWCTVVHVLAFALFAVVMVESARSGAVRDSTAPRH